MNITCFGCYRSLEELNANFNKLKKLPDTIGFELVNLEKLSVNSNKLDFLPYSITHLTNLRVLDARLNCLRSLPKDLDNLTKLQVLNVSQNFQYLEGIPDSIGLLASLTELDISYNKITVLPYTIGCLAKLQKLSVEGNPLVSPPLEIFEQSLNVVKEYLCEMMNKSPNSSSSSSKSKWGLGKLFKWKTFNNPITSTTSPRDRDQYPMADYRSINGLTSPRFGGLFSPRRLFSPRSTPFSR